MYIPTQQSLFKSSPTLDARDRSFRIWAVTVISVIFVILLGLVDYYSDPYLSLLVFYLIPISLSIWFANIPASVCVLILSAAAWFIDDVVSARAYSHPAIPYWDLAAKAIFFIIVIFILSALRRAFEFERTQARTDHLTGLVNRRHFFECARIELDRVKRYKHPITVIFIDVDDFKRVNDMLGHRVGDTLLRVVSATLNKCIRSTDVAARMGGDEFIIMLTETPYESASVTIQRIQKELLSAMQLHKWPVTFSIGAVTCHTYQCAVDALITTADNMMYKAKRAGKNMIKHEMA